MVGLVVVGEWFGRISEISAGAGGGMGRPPQQQQHHLARAQARPISTIKPAA